MEAIYGYGAIFVYFFFEYCFHGNVNINAYGMNVSCPWNCTCVRRTLDCSERDLLEVPCQFPVGMEVLNLSSNPLLQESFSFCLSVGHIQTLKLSNVTVIRNFQGRNVSCNVSSLFMTHNHLGHVMKDLSTMFPQVSFLDLSHNEFSTLDNSSFPFMDHLNILLLEDNFIESISKEFFESVPVLETLKLNRNIIKSLKKGIFSSMKSLKILELEFNKLTVIESLTFSGLDNLITLKLKHNFISHIMDGSFWGLSSIQNLDLSANNISSLHYKWLYGLESLQQLSLAHNKISRIEEDTWKFCKNITDLNLRFNRLTSLSGDYFKMLHSLKKLQLQHNGIAYIAESTFHHLTSLKSLDLGYNNLTWSLDDSGTHFDNMASLNRLSLEQNKIRSLSKRLFRDLSALKYLNIAGKSLASVQARAFENLLELKNFIMNSSNMLCDCQLTWLLDWLHSFKFDVQARCGYPESLRGRPLIELHRDDLKCISFSKPIITQEPQPIKALLHGNATLTCVAASTGKSPVFIEWKKDNNMLEDNKNLQVKTELVSPSQPASAGTTITEVVSRVIMQPVVHDHAGMYQCVATNIIGSSHSSKALFTVNVYPSFIKIPSPKMMVRIGATTRLDCSATGLPTPVIKLQKDGGDDFPAARERRMHIYPSDERLFIVSVKLEDQGIYTCSASNAVGIITTNTSLQVLEPPQFVKKIETNKTSVEGETTVFECLARGSPYPKIEWLKNSQPLVFTLRHFSTEESQFLIIVQTSKADEGDYSCVISNTLGSEKQTIHLSVTNHNTKIAEASLQTTKEDSSYTTAGVIVIAIVCYIVGTSLVWVCIIYSRTRSLNVCAVLRNGNSRVEEAAWQSEGVLTYLARENYRNVPPIISTKHPVNASQHRLACKDNELIQNNNRVEDETLRLNSELIEGGGATTCNCRDPGGDVRRIHEPQHSLIKSKNSSVLHKLCRSIKPCPESNPHQLSKLSFVEISQNKADTR